MHVLLVPGTTGNVRSKMKALYLLGCELTTKLSVGEAYRAIAQKSFSAAIIDVQLQNGTGLYVAGKFHEHFPYHQPILLLHDQEVYREDAIEDIIDAHHWNAAYVDLRHESWESAVKRFIQRTKEQLQGGGAYETNTGRRR